jgi:hypothetical protein
MADIMICRNIDLSSWALQEDTKICWNYIATVKLFDSQDVQNISM